MCNRSRSSGLLVPLFVTPQIQTHFYIVRLETGELIKLSSRTAVKCLQDKLPNKFHHPPIPDFVFSLSPVVHSLYAARKGSSTPPSLCIFRLSFLPVLHGGGRSCFCTRLSATWRRFGGATGALHTPGSFSHEKATLVVEFALLLQAIAHPHRRSD